MNPVSARNWPAQLTAAGVALPHRAPGQEIRLRKRDAFTIRADEPADWKQLFATLAGDAAPERIVYLWTLDEQTGIDERGCADGHRRPAAPDPRPGGDDAGGQAAHRSRHARRPAGGTRHGRDRRRPGPAIGLFRVILSEHPNFSCRGIDLPPAASADRMRPCSGTNCFSADTEREVALRGEARYVQRLTRGLPTREQTLDASVPLRLESRERGLLDSLRFTPFAAAGLRARRSADQGQGRRHEFPRRAQGARALSGRDGGRAHLRRRSGRRGDGRRRRRHARGAGRPRLRSRRLRPRHAHAGARPPMCGRCPQGLSFEEAATLPVVFMTAWYALKTVARMKAGEIDPRSRRRGRRRHGGDPDRPSSRRRGHRLRRQPDQTRPAARRSASSTSSTRGAATSRRPSWN